MMSFKIFALIALLYPIFSHKPFQYPILEQKQIFQNNINLQSACSYENRAITSQITVDFSCGTFEILNCQVSNSPGFIFINSESNFLTFYVASTSFVNCSVTGNQSDTAVLYFNSGQLIMDHTYGYLVQDCTFTECGQIFYVWNNDQPPFHVNSISISKTVEMFEFVPGQGPNVDQCVITYIIDQLPYTDCKIYDINYSDSNDVVSRFVYMMTYSDMKYISVMNITTRQLFSIYDCNLSINCININRIEFSQVNPRGAIFDINTDLTVSNAVFFNFGNVTDNIYLVYSTDSPAVSFDHSYTTLTKTSIYFSGTLNVIDDRYDLDSYDCHVVLNPTNIFTESYNFSASTRFTQSSNFTESYNFSSSTRFKQSSNFTKSYNFSSSTRFKQSSNFSEPNKFTKLAFNLSKEFSASSNFSQSVKFSSSNNLSTVFFTFSSWFSKSTQFSLSSSFSRSLNFSLSSDFTRSNTFTPSNVFTPSDSKYVYYMRMSRQAKLPPQTSQYGALSNTAMATVSTSVIIAIILVGSILMIFYVRQQKRNMVEPELPDLLQLPSDSSDTTDDCAISFSYSLKTASREDDPFRMDPEFYLNLKD